MSLFFRHLVSELILMAWKKWKKKKWTKGKKKKTWKKKGSWKNKKFKDARTYRVKREKLVSAEVRNRRGLEARGRQVAEMLAKV